MPVPQTVCPECAAKLSSKDGFAPGQKIRCPKCETVFAVPAPKRKPVALEVDEDEPRRVKKKPAVVEDDAEDERPRKKKKQGGKGKAGREGGYATSPVRFVILGVLLVIMGVMGYFLYKKMTAPPLPDIIVPAKNQPGED